MGLKKFSLVPVVLVSIFALSCGENRSQCGTSVVKNTSEKVQPVKREQNVYTLTLKADPSFLKTLLDEGFKFEYYDGRVTVELPDKGSVLQLLTLYNRYREFKSKDSYYRYTVRQLIADDIAKVRKTLQHLQEQYDQIAPLLIDRGIDLNFDRFEDEILKRQKAVYDGYLSYWDKKYEQLKSDFQIAVTPPQVKVNDLIIKAKTFFYGNDLKARLFKFYLLKKLNEARLEADLYKYKEYGSGN